MKKWLKGILIACVTLLIAAFVGVAIIILTFDPTVYKDKLASMIKTQYDRELIVKGDINLSLFPRIGLNVSDLSLSERGSSEVFAHIDNVRLAVAIWPLMSNRFLVDHMAITGAQVKVIRDENGLLNFEDMISSPANEEAPKSPVSTEQKSNREQLSDWLKQTDFKVDVAGLSIQKSAILYQDQGQQHKVQLNNLQVDTGRITLGQPFDIQLRADLLGEQPSAEAKLQINGLLLLNPAERQYSAQKLQATLEGRVNKLNIEEASLQGNVNLDTLSYAIVGKSVQLKLNASGLEQSPIESMNLSLVAPELNYNDSDLSLHLHNFDMQGNVNRKDKRAIELNLNSPELDVSPTKAGGKPLTGKMRIQQLEQQIDLGFSLVNISGTAQDLKVEQVQLTGVYQHDEKRKLDIELKSSGLFNLFSQQMNLPHIMGEIHLQDKDDSKQAFPITGSSKVDLRQDQMDFSVNLLSSQGNFAVKGILNNFFQPRISFDVEADQFRLDDFFADLVFIDTLTQPTEAAPGTQESAPKSKTSVELTAKPIDNTADKTSQTPATEQVTSDSNSNSPKAIPHTGSVLSFKQELLSRLSGVGTFNFKQLSYHDTIFNNLGATLIFDHSDVQIKSLKADAFDGKFSANGEYALGSGKLRADATFTDVRAEALLAQFKADPLLNGQMNLRLEVQSQGINEADLLAHLQGTVGVDLKEGYFNGLSLREMASDPMVYMLNDKSAQTSLTFDFTKQTPFKEIKLTSTIADHQLRLEVFTVDGPDGKFHMDKEPAFYNWQSDKMHIPGRLYITQPILLQHEGVQVRVNQLDIPILISGERGGFRLYLHTQSVPSP